MKKIYFVSLGCDKNLVDSEEMMGMLQKEGYLITNDEYEADIAIVNTCCFIHDAKEESIEAIIEMGRLKEEGNLKGLVICGCLAQRYKDEIEKELPEVDAIIGTAAINSIIDACNKITVKEKNADLIADENADFYISDLSGKIHINKNRILTGAGYTAYLKIAEGCDKHCTYCIIPKIRGPFRSIPMEEIIEEAKCLADSGVKELVLIAQETTLYGIDLYGKKRLHELLQELCKINSLVWIRVLYCYPEEIYDELIDIFAAEKKICKYIDIPIQHCSNNILKKMGRRTSKEDIIAIVKKLRKKVPDITIRTTLITGFPGETNEDHEEVLEFVDRMEFDRLGVFTYSAEEDTPAATMDEQIDEEIKKERLNEIMSLQQEISYDKNQRLIGKEMMVIIEGYMPDDVVYVGRTYRDTAGIDGNVFIKSDSTLMSGDIITVKIISANEYDLIGEML